METAKETSTHTQTLLYYSSIYQRIFRYGPIMLSFVIASIIFGIVIHGSNTHVDAYDQDHISDNKDTDPTADPLHTTGTISGTDVTQTKREDTIIYKKANYNMDTFLQTISFFDERERQLPDENTIISKGDIHLGAVDRPITITINHQSGDIQNIMDINTQYPDINEAINEVIHAPGQSSLNILIALKEKMTVKVGREVTCNHIQEKLSSLGQIICNESSIEVRIINDEYKRSYFFYHHDFAIDHIESSDPKETKVFNTVKNIETTPDTIASVIEKIIKKRIIQHPQIEEKEDESSIIAHDIEKYLGVHVTSVKQKETSFGVSFVLSGINLFTIYHPEEKMMQGLVFKDTISQKKPLSIQHFNLIVTNQAEVKKFVDSPLDYVEAIQKGAKELYYQSQRQ